MIRVRLTLALAALVSATALAAEPAPDKGMVAAGETLSDWPWFLEFPLPPPGKARYYDLLVPPAVLDRSASRPATGPRPGQFEPKGRPDPRAGQTDWAQGELSDLRLYDARDREVPYALRVRRPVNTRQNLNVGTFNPSTDEKGQATVSLDLGQDVRHNAIQIRTSGSNFRRPVHVESSDDRTTWVEVLKADLLSFHVGGQSLEVYQFDYPENRRRYLRVQVWPDPALEKDRPRLEGVTVSQVVEVPGLEEPLPAHLGPREPVRTPGGPGSAWTIDFDNLTVPVNRVEVDAEDREFVRPFRLEMPDGDGFYTVLHQGEWRREARGERKPLEIAIPEVWTRRLRLVVTDSRNPPLQLTQVRCTAWARQLIFAATNDLAGPLRLYVGKPEAETPRYDFAAALPGNLVPPPLRLDVDKEAVRKNPTYRPPPLPWTERYPWLVYVVLSVASLALLGIMIPLSRQALARTGAAPVSDAS